MFSVSGNVKCFPRATLTPSLVQTIEVTITAKLFFFFLILTGFLVFRNLLVLLWRMHHTCKFGIDDVGEIMTETYVSCLQRKWHLAVSCIISCPWPRTFFHPLKAVNPAPVILQQGHRTYSEWSWPVSSPREKHKAPSWSPAQAVPRLGAGRPETPSQGLPHCLWISVVGLALAMKPCPDTTWG